MPDFQLVIPTHMRPDRQKTLSRLPPELQRQVIIVTSTAEDAAAIRRNYKHENIIVARGTSCIADKRHWIMKNIKARFIFMMDDDLRFDNRCALAERRWSTLDGGSWITRKPETRLMHTSTPQQLLRAFKAIEQYSHRYGAIGMGHRWNHHTIPGDWELRHRMIHAFGVERSTYLRLGLDFGEVPIREDMHVTLRLLENGVENAVYFDTVCDPGDYNASGGAHDERSLEQSNAEAYHLARLHPGLVQVVDRKYKQSLQRKEVIIAWAKAFRPTKRLF